MKMAETHLAESRDQLKQENSLLRSSMRERYRFGNIIGKCQVMQDMYEAMINAAETSANVVLYGESGIGKELVAREIHAMSVRKDRRFEEPVYSTPLSHQILETSPALRMISSARAVQ